MGQAPRTHTPAPGARNRSHRVRSNSRAHGTRQARPCIAPGAAPANRVRAAGHGRQTGRLRTPLHGAPNCGTARGAIPVSSVRRNARLSVAPGAAGDRSGEPALRVSTITPPYVAIPGVHNIRNPRSVNVHPLAPKPCGLRFRRCLARYPNRFYAASSPSSLLISWRSHCLRTSSPSLASRVDIVLLS